MPLHQVTAPESKPSGSYGEGEAERDGGIVGVAFHPVGICLNGAESTEGGQGDLWGKSSALIERLDLGDCCVSSRRQCAVRLR